MVMVVAVVNGGVRVVVVGEVEVRVAIVSVDDEKKVRGNCRLQGELIRTISDFQTDTHLGHHHSLH